MTGYRVKGGGGGLTGGAANVEHGPTFGNETRNNTFEIGAAVTAPDQALTIPMGAGAAITEVNNDTRFSLSAGAAVTVPDQALSTSMGAGAAITSTVLEIPRLNTDDDAWVEQANPNTNHGADVDLEVRSANALGNGEERALIEFDLSGLTGLSTNDASEFVFYASESAVLLNPDLSLQFRTFAADAFDESTVTWNNQPAGTLEFTKTQTIAGSPFVEYRVSITAAEMDSLLGNFVMVRCVNGNTVDTPQILIKSKEAASSTQHPRLENITLSPV